MIATGASLKPLASRFGLKPSSLYNHSKKHVSAEYRAAVRLGPFESETRLRQLCAENGVSVVETLRAVNAGVSARWLAAFEAEADDTFISLTAQMRKNLELLARLTRELMPQPSVVNTTNNFMLFEHPEYVQVIAALSIALRPFPEARQAVLATLRSFRTAGERVLIDAQPTTAP